MTAPAIVSAAGGTAARRAQSGPADPFWASVVLLLNGDSLLDASGRHSLIANDGEVISSDGMLSFDGASALRIDDNLDDFSFSGSYTIEGQIKAPTGGGTGLLVSNNDTQAGSWGIWVRGPANYNGGFYQVGGPYREDPSGLVDGSVHNFAYVFDAGLARMFVYKDGVLDVGFDASVAGLIPTPGPLYIGREVPSINTQFFTGLMRLRITNGVARYVDDTYAPPTWPVPAD